MTNPTIYITQDDHRRLALLLDEAIGSSDPRLRADLRRLVQDLQSAQVVAPGDVPADVVTLNSRVEVKDLDDDDEETWVLCLQKDADIAEQKLSVLSPVGAALLGARVGEVVSWSSNGNSGRLKIEKLLFQPEAAGMVGM